MKSSLQGRKSALAMFVDGEERAVEDAEERGAVDHQQVIGAWVTPAESDESPDNCGSMDVAYFEAIPCAETPDDGGSGGVRGFMVVAVETEGPSFRSVGAAV